MKIPTLIILIVFAISVNTKAQDIITLKSGEEIKAHIIRLNPKEVTFTLDAKPDTLSFQRDSVLKLRYNTGIVIYLTESQQPEFFFDAMNDSLYFLGAKDAKIYYRGYRLAATGTLFASFFIPWGLIPAITCSVTPPSMQSLGYQDQNLIKNPSYYKGYADKAFKIKKKKVWKNFAIGTGATLGLYIMSILAVSAIIVE